MDKYLSPEANLDVFTCPHCEAMAHHEWKPLFILKGSYHKVPNLKMGICKNPSCRRITIWIVEKMIYPLKSNAPFPLEDMPEDVKADFIEARDVLSMSPRSAAALLRLALQKLLVHLGESGDNINGDIASLVQKGLPASIQKALDSVRVIGNEAVHPGELDLKDDTETALKLFRILNVTVQSMITQPKEIDEIYRSLPESKIEGINKRDQN